jgi:BASS family bile acid:Na+ symporter
VVLALQVSVISTVFGFGLRARQRDIADLFQRPGLLLRSLLAVLIIMPLLAVALVWTFDVRRAAEVALVALAISPMPPLLPRRESKTGGPAPFALALLVVLSLLAIVTIPLTSTILESLATRPLGASAGAIVRIILAMTLAPLVVGMAVHTMSPGLADSLGRLAERVGTILIPVAIVALLAGTWRAIFAATGEGTILALLVFVVAGLAVGHLLGRPLPEHSIVLALTTACRHPAIAFTIASANFPDEHFAGTILLYVIVNTIVGLLYLAWMRGRMAADHEGGL